MEKLCFVRDHKYIYLQYLVVKDRCIRLYYDVLTIYQHILYCVYSVYSVYSLLASSTYRCDILLAGS